MSKRATIVLSIVPALVALMLCLPGTTSLQVAVADSSILASPPQKVPESTGDSVKPVKGVDVIVQRVPGNIAVRSVTTDSAGRFTLPVLPIGSYSLKLELPKGRGGIAVDSNRRSATTHTSMDRDDPLRLTIEGSVGGPIKAGWSLQTNATVDVSPPSTDKAARKLRFHEYTPPGLTTIMVKSDGKTPLTGTVEMTIVKSKSNISNN